MTLIRAIQPEDAAAVAGIFNYYIENTIVTFEEQAIDSAEMLRRIEAHPSHLPWLVFEAEGDVVGYALLTSWNSRCSYRESLESTVYLDPEAVGKGIGSRLYSELLGFARKGGFHTIMGGISLPNPASQALHEKFGYKKVAEFKEVGFKFGKRIDVGYWQVMLRE